MAKKVSGVTILALADVHIHDYTLYSTIDDEGVPSRLRDFSRLAEEIRYQAVQHSADVIVIAGDLLQSSNPRPMVLNHAQAFLKEVAVNELPVILIVGQHDLDNKNETNNSLHSVVTPILPLFDNIRYVVDRESFIIDGVTFFAKSWTSNQSDVSDQPDADVFVGHGLVINAKDPYGHVFENGFSAPQLQEKYAVSIIGDIHNPNVWVSKANGAAVIVPGQPLQSNYSSGPPGMWAIRVENSKYKWAKRIGLEDTYRYREFHQFRIIEDEQYVAETPDPYVHYRIWESKRKKGEPRMVDESENPVTDLYNVVARQLEADELGACLPMLRAAYEGIGASDTRAAAESRLKTLSIRDFLSIIELDLDFSTMAGLIGVFGENGTGKTTVVEALYWCLTGELTKEVSADRINFNYGKKPATVTAVFEVGGEEYRATRARKTPLLQLWKGDANLTKGSAKETQALIYGLLGIEKEDILTLLYYSVKESNTFTSLTPGQRQDFLGKASGVEVLVKLQEAFGQRLDVLDRDIVKWSGREQANTRIAEDAKTKMDAAVEALRVAKNVRKRSDVQKEIDAAQSELADEKPYYDAREAHVAAGQRLADAGTRLRNTRERLVEAEAELEAAKDGKCKACGAPLKDAKEHARTHAAGVKDLRAAVKSLEHSVKEADAAVVAARAVADEKKSIPDGNAVVKQRIAALQAELRSMPPDKDHAAEVRLHKANLAEYAARLVEDRAWLEEHRGLAALAKRVKLRYLSRDSAAARELSRLVGKSLEREINKLVGDPRLYHVEVGEDLSIQARFPGEKDYRCAGEMSSGERRLTDILVLVALNNVFNRYFGIPDGILGVVFLDEIFSYLGDRYTDLVFECVKALSTQTVVLITHDDRIKDYVDKALLVTKKPGFGSEFRMVD